MKYSVHLSDTTAEETRQAILAPLREYNQSQTGPNEHRGLAIELRDEKDSIIGGLWGGSSYDTGYSFSFLLCHRLCEAKASAAS